MESFLYAVASALLISVLSFLGAFFLLSKKRRDKGLILMMVAFASGSMLGASFFDLIPEAFEEVGTFSTYFIFFGIIIFLLLESYVHWHHCTIEECGIYSKKSMGYMNLIADGIHNFIDGVIIASAYQIDIGSGIVATIAIALHEIPQEAGDFAVLIHAGFGRSQALIYNFVSAILALVGTFFGFLFLSLFEYLIPYFASVAAGGFIYIATADLFPEISKHISKHRNIKRLSLQIISLFLGSGIIFMVVNFVGR
ncbi:MAG: ZIP family metal transporter [Candidatus Anstonellales archaeon]